MLAPDRSKSNLSKFVPADPASIELQILVDRVCTSFESQWHSKHKPSIEQYIAANPGINSHLLLKELIPIELEMRSRESQHSEVDEFIERFPQDRDIVKQIFEDFVNSRPNDSQIDNTLPRYLRRAELARGGMGVVYEGWDRLLRREVAIKVMDEPLADDWEARARFQREPRICGSLQHPNIIPIYDVGTTEDGSAFFVMKRIHGETLDKWLDEAERSKSLEQKLEVFLGVARAVASAHRNHIIHRDIKPSNIMIAEFGEVYVMDWGLAGRDGDSTDLPTQRYSTDGTCIDTPLTQCGAIFGTPEYMAPEQQKQSQRYARPQVDVYSLGALLCWMLTRKSPHRLLAQTAEQTGKPTDIALALKSRGIDDFLSKLVIRCIASQPEERYETASELVEHVEAYQTWMAASVRDAQRKADAAVNQAKLVRLRWQATGIACSLLTVIAIGGLWSAQSTANAKRKRINDATRILSRVENIYATAAATGDFKSPHWQQAIELHASFQPPLESLREDPVVVKNANLGRKLQLMSSLRDVPKYEFDESAREFVIARYRDTGLGAIASFGIRAQEMTAEEASERLDVLSRDARRMIAGFLIDCCVSAKLHQETFENISWWHEFASIEEQKTWGTSLLGALIRFDKEVILDLVETKTYHNLPPELLISLAAFLSATEDSKLAEEVFRFAVNRYPKSFSLNNDFSYFLQRQKPKRAVEAIQFSSAAWTLQRHEASMLGLAWCLLECGMFERSVELIETNEKELLANAGALKPFVRELIALGQLDKAEKVLRIIEARGGADSLLHLLKGELATAYHQFATAEREFALARSFCGDDAKQIAEISYLEGKLGNLNDICSRLENFYVAYPDQHEIIFYLAQTRQSLEQFEIAEELYRKCLALRPDDAEAICNLAFCVNRLNRREEALDLYREGHKLGSKQRKWNYNSASWITTTESEIAIANEIDFHVRNQLSKREPTKFYSLITEFLRPMKRFDSAYSLCKVIPENIRDPKLWLTAASIAADHLATQLAEDPELAQSTSEEVMNDMLSWMERAVSIAETAPLTGPQAGPRGKYFILAMRNAMETETYRTLRESKIHDSLPTDASEKLKSLWLRLEKRADSILEVLG